MPLPEFHLASSPFYSTIYLSHTNERRVCVEPAGISAFWKLRISARSSEFEKRLAYRNSADENIENHTHKHGLVKGRSFLSVSSIRFSDWMNIISLQGNAILLALVLGQQGLRSKHVYIHAVIRSFVYTFPLQFFYTIVLKIYLIRTDRFLFYIG